MKTIVSEIELPFVVLINSEHHHGPGCVTDHLDEPDWIAALNKRWGLPEAPPGVLLELRELRVLLRTAVKQLMKDRRLAPDVLNQLNGWLDREKRGVRVHEGHNGYELVESTASLASYVTRSFAIYVTTQDVRRLKFCANTSCQLAFQDVSRNRSKRWCSSRACGNLTKVRAFRQRAKTMERDRRR